MNQRDGIDHREWLDADAAAELLGIKRQTLYAYASRGRVRSVPIEGSRARRYARADLLRIRARRDARSGHGAVAAGALRWGEPVLDSAITEIAGDDFRYRGHSALRLAERGIAFERVAELLWTGTLPEAASFEAGSFEAGSLGVSSSRLAPLVSTARSIDVLLATVPVIALADDARHVDDLDATLAAARRLVRRMVGALALPRGPGAVAGALEAGSVARGLLVALGGRTSRAAVAMTDRALVLCADHELNPSSFSARVTASVGADVYACVASALATLSGPKHGRGPDRVEALVSEVDRPERAVRVVRERARRGEAVPGFGHPLYPGGDPRALPMLEDAERVAGRNRVVRTVRALVEAMALAGGPPPTIDCTLVATAAAAGLPAGSAPAIFAIGRVAGWIAHVLEQRAAGFVLRPRARYVGPPAPAAS